MDWETLRAEAMACRKCKLADTRTNVVFGVGSREAEIMFVGEGPGKNEDEQGEPFVGLAGQLLDKILLAAGFSRRENVYIANMVKCRPPANRDPERDEVDACIGWLREQTRLLSPKIIVCLGRVAAQYIISPAFKVTKQHGELIRRGGTYLMGTFHPAAILRNPANKEDMFADILKARDLLEELRAKEKP